MIAQKRQIFRGRDELVSGQHLPMSMRASIRGRKVGTLHRIHKCTQYSLVFKCIDAKMG